MSPHVLAHAGTPDELLSTLLVGTALVAFWIGRTRVKERGFGSLPRWGGRALVALAPLALVGAVVLPSLLRAPRPASTATISFVHPAPGASVAGPTMDVEVRLTGGTIVDGTSTDLRPDTGHVHVFLDGEMVSMAYATRGTIPIEELAPGEHELTAEFVAADHNPFSPPVTTSVTFVAD